MTYRMLTAAAAGLAVSAALGAGALAQDAHPDLTGYYYSVRGPVPEDPELMAKIAPNTVRLQDLGPIEYPKGEFGGLEATPEALEKAANWSPEDDMTLSKACEVPGMIYTMQGPFPFKIHQGQDFIIIQLEYFDLTRIVFMNGEHPDEGAPHTKMGHSIGWWEDDTLVIETTHLSEATITNNGLNFSENAKSIERYTLSEDGQTLLGTQEFEDPDVLNNRGVRVMAWDRSPVSEYIYPYECDPSFGANFGLSAGD